MDINKETLKREKWLQYLVFTKEKKVNVERVNKVSDINGTETLQYTLRTLEILEKWKDKISATIYHYIEKALQWSEVAKGGRISQRKIWRMKGYPLEVHNLASADIFAEEHDLEFPENKIIYTLIQTHGIIGQVIRGEVPMAENVPLYKLIEEKLMTETDLKVTLLILNECILKAVSEEIYQKTRKEVEEIVLRITKGDFREFTLKERMSRLLPVFNETEEIPDFYESLLSGREFWYTEAALNAFQLSDVNTIFRCITEKIEDSTGIKHISFYNTARFLYYDYEEKKKINVYKKRVIESFLKNTKNNTHIDLEYQEENGVLLVGFCMTPACEKLIEFCVEAERSGILTYEKSITLLFDLFGFRKDEFDRLNNEEKYLNTMNSVGSSTKKDIINEVKGDVIIDVGSGGGVMLELLENAYPDKKIIGTDISKNVVEHLREMKKEKGHHFDIQVHNFVESDFTSPKPDTIIFSSILHEIFSYTELNGKKFNIDSVKQALRHAADSLNSGGRIVIRDGVKTDSSETVIIQFKNEKGIEFLKNYLRDFKGLPEQEGTIKIDKEENSATMDINLAREFMYTYTWGQESYAHEVQEQFGYFTLREIVKFTEEELGMKVIKAREFLEPGYKKHLFPEMELQHLDGTEAEFPNSTYILVLEK